ncbi:hypothetical protein [Pseudonocardia endophytica]|uniref:DUF485 domain-containing protein n=1 Tax=Pseudonocardia endophytica TaxID=401976 RepID=A0A4R1HXC9_PSEEN|nr:hypothetical protein [Pseudonocardia endophytica]TCK27434.1 hypothetical protein EV378_3305 [Pseudonocardia endophytica]
MSTHTDGAASPSVGGADDADGDGAVGAPVFGPDASPPRPRAHSDGNRNAGAGDAGWVQQEIQRRIAAKGGNETGRHSRSDRARTAPGDDGDPPPDGTPPPRAVTATGGTPRRRSTRVPDPYAPDGMREEPDASSFPEGPFRMPGPAASSPEPRGPVADPARTAPPPTPPKQWPPAGLPRRVPGAGWTLDRPGGTTGADGVDDIEPETRIVPALWAAGSNGTRAAGVVAPERVVEDYPYDDEDDDLDDDLDDLAPTGLTGDTEVIWRAPGLDEPPVPAPPPMEAPSPNPHTGVRPRRFAGATTDVEQEPDVDEDARPECPDLDSAPQGKRKRIVLSERRTVAQSVRGVVDVQDPGPVGSMLRSQLVSTQLRISLQVGGVALLGLFVMPALFAAFPSIGEVSLFGIRLPWLLLGFLTYPFLLLLGWWFVGSAEHAEQDFMQEVQDR